MILPRHDLVQPCIYRLPTKNLLPLNHNQTHQFPFFALTDSRGLIAAPDKKPLFPQFNVLLSALKPFGSLGHVKSQTWALVNPQLISHMWVRWIRELVRRCVWPVCSRRRSFESERSRAAVIAANGGYRQFDLPAASVSERDGAWRSGRDPASNSPSAPCSVCRLSWTLCCCITQDQCRFFPNQ